MLSVQDRDRITGLAEIYEWFARGFTRVCCAVALAVGLLLAYAVTP